MGTEVDELYYNLYEEQNKEQMLAQLENPNVTDSSIAGDANFDSVSKGKLSHITIIYRFLTNAAQRKDEIKKRMEELKIEYRACQQELKEIESKEDRIKENLNEITRIITGDELNGGSKDGQ